MWLCVNTPANCNFPIIGDRCWHTYICSDNVTFVAAAAVVVAVITAACCCCIFQFIRWISVCLRKLTNITFNQCVCEQLNFSNTIYSQ